MSPWESAGPKLLVSVRSCEEAVHAIHGGADILDIKEPSRGSLGMSDMDVIREIAARVASGALNAPLSIALGELMDWWEAEELPLIQTGVTFAKMGLSHVARHKNWQMRWQELRCRFDDARAQPLQWVAVAYADSENALSPSADEVLIAAEESDCAGLLIDTWSKTGQNLTDFISADDLAEFAVRCHGNGMFLALAGSLKIDQLPLLGDVGADVIAIRSAACRSQSRCEEIDETAVRSFRTAMASAFCRHNQRRETRRDRLESR